MKLIHLYQGVIFILAVTMLMYISSSTKNYKDLLEVYEDSNERYETTLAKVREDHVNTIVSYETAYEDLQNEYRDLQNEYETLEIAEMPTYEYTEEEIYLLAQCVQAEAGYYNNAPNSQKYVTQVILNRVKSKHFPNTIREVIYEKYGNIPQFSVAYNGMIDREVEPETLMNVYSVIVNGTDMPDDVLFFYSARVKESWVNKLNTYKAVEGTVFAYN